jgi:hypothetical protein
MSDRDSHHKHPENNDRNGHDERQHKPSKQHKSQSGQGDRHPKTFQHFRVGHWLLTSLFLFLFPWLKRDAALIPAIA